MNIVKHMEAIFVTAAITLCALSYPSSHDETPVASYTVEANSSQAATPAKPA